MKHIFVVDDDQMILEAVQILLETAGYRVTVVSEISEVIDEVVQAQPDLLLLDLLLSGEDGRDVARHIKEQSITAKMPIIMMSADTQIKEKTKEAGADAYIKKPFDIDELEAMLTKYLQSQ
jgi:two-component system alkaline phosphatase synthesis response regulator PhoP